MFLPKWIYLEAEEEREMKTMEPMACWNSWCGDCLLVHQRISRDSCSSVELGGPVEIPLQSFWSGSG